jgi:hypothetical protein
VDHKMPFNNSADHKSEIAAEKLTIYSRKIAEN